MIIGNLFFNYLSEFNRGDIMSQRTMFEAKCTGCGKTCTVPFKPTAGKPVYCRECFSKHNSRPAEASSKSGSFVGKEAWARRRDNGQTKKEEEHIGVFRKFTHAPE
jgi:CxxC-x17-CxxC domain-containing protein